MPVQPQSVAGLAAGLASETTDRAADLAITSTALAADLAIKQANRNAEIEREAGRREAQVDARLDGHEDQLREVKGAVGDIRSGMGDVGKKFEALNSSFREHIAVETALAAALETATSRGISARAHYISLAVFLVMLTGLIVGTGHA